MRICIITKYIPPVSTDGIPRNRWDYARQFTALGHEVHIITSGSAESEEIVEGIYIHRIHPSDKGMTKDVFNGLPAPGFVLNHLAYSYLVYNRIKRLHEAHPIHLIESPLWDIEGYITRLKFPEIPFVVRLETTSMLLREILTGNTPKKDVLNEIESHFLQIASGYVFDSWSILKETERLYKIRFDKKPYAVVHHGIDLGKDMYLDVKAVAPGKNLKVLSVGRLEKRKGSDILVKEMLPLLIKEDPDLEIHLVGKDSGEWDGFKEETGFTYHEYIQKNFKPYINRRIFLYGYVSDAKLDELYEGADIVLALSRYESFGLLYLEAMRKGKPLIVFNTGAVPEIFDDGRDAVVLPVDQPEKAVAAIIRLKGDSGLRAELGKNAQKKLTEKFSAQRMAKECLAFYEDLAFDIAQTRVFQVMNCLTDRDGVSNTTIDFDRLLKEQGESTRILATSATEPLRHLVSPIEQIRFKEHDLVIYHYWNHCERAEYFNGLTLPKKVFFFHNMTTPSFFSETDEAFHATSRGFRQLGNLDNFDVFAGHTNYSLEILRQSLGRPITTHVIPPWIDKALILNRPYDKELVEKMAGGTLFHLLFVGSIAPHKKQTDLVKFFHYYSRNINPESHLTIIGGGSPRYTGELTTLIKELNLEKQVTVTGKISNEELYAYYRTADVYLSMCEHEGFGIPLAEAMVFNLPVVAYNCTAIPDTVGDNNCLFDQKDPALVSSIVEKLRNDKAWKKEVLDKQSKQLETFAHENVIKAFKELWELVQEKHQERLMFIRSQPDYLVEEFVYYNDERLTKGRDQKYVDDQFLLLDGRYPISLTEDFCDVECSFLSHDWSGKVNIRVDDLPAREVDLFSANRRIKTVKLQLQLNPGKHTLHVWPVGERSSFSKGNEVFLQLIRLLKPFNRASGSEENDKDGKEPGTGAALLLSENGSGGNIDFTNETGSPEYTNYEAAPDKRLVRLSEDAAALSDLFHYDGSWSVKDEIFQFSNGTADNSISFEKDFVNLELKFIAHGWCGALEVTIDDTYREIIDLYRPEHSRIAVRIKKTFEQKSHRVVLKTLHKKNNASNGYEVFFGGIIVEQHFPVEITEQELEANYKVSVIINTLDRADHLEKLLLDLSKQTYKYFEVVAVNGPSKDRTAEILNGYSDRLKIAHCPEANLSQSRNIGIENSAGDYVAFIDDDALPCNKYWIENFVYFIIWKQLKRIGAVGGPVKHRETEHYEFKNGATSDYGFQIFREEELKSHKLDGKRWVQGVPGGNNIVIKEALYEIGGFDERFIYYLDETDMCIRLARKGYAIINHPINHIKHFKAPSKVRKSNYDIRWDIIARSDMYYAIKNGFDALPIRVIKAISYFRKKHFYMEVVKAYKDGKIPVGEYRKYRELLRKGFKEGLKWGLFNRKTTSCLQKRSVVFSYFKEPDPIAVASVLS